MQRRETKRKETKPSRRPRPAAAQPRRDDGRYETHTGWKKKAARLERETSSTDTPEVLREYVATTFRLLPLMFKALRRIKWDPVDGGPPRTTLVQRLLDLGALTQFDLEVHDAAQGMDIYLEVDADDRYLRALLAFNPFLRRVAELYRLDIIEKYGPTTEDVEATTKLYLAGGPAVAVPAPTQRKAQRRAA